MNSESQVPVGLDSLILSLSAAALAYMGRQIGASTERVEPSLPLAKHTISTLDMLKAKTEGNRTEDESKLLDELLYELRMSYVRAEEELKRSEAKPAEPKAGPRDGA